MAVDATGNIWVTGFTNSRSNPVNAIDVSSGMIAEFSNLGAPLTPPSSLPSGSSSSPTYGGYIPLTLTTVGNGGTQNSHAISIDPSGNAWILGGSAYGGFPNSDANNPAGMTEISPSPSTNPRFSVVQPDIKLGGLTASPIAIDGVGNLWLFGGPPDPNTGGSDMSEFDNTGKLLKSNPGSTGPATNPFGYYQIQSLTFDSNGTAPAPNAGALWGFAPFITDIFQISTVDASDVASYYPILQGNIFTSLVAAAANANGTAGNVYGCGDPGPVDGNGNKTLGSTLDAFNVSTTSILSPTYPIPTGRGCGNQMVMDGAGHIFAVTGNTAPGILDEFSVTGGDSR